VTVSTVKSQTEERLIALDREIQAIALDADTSDVKKTKLAGEAVATAFKELQSVRKAMTTKSGAATTRRPDCWACLKRRPTQPRTLSSTSRSDHACLACHNTSG